jgi:CheY-like chemotaxis protein
MPSAPRILIAGDDAIITHLVSTMLQKKGYTVAGIAVSGGEAMQKTAELVPDLVILDAEIGGGMDGTDAAHYVFQLFHIPVVFITGTSDETRLDRLKLACPYGVVFKPFAAAEITTAVDCAVYAHADRVTVLGNPPFPEPRKMLDNTTEATILLDRRGRIIFLNTFATWFTDITAKGAVMRPWRDVMMFVSEQTGGELPDPVADVIQRQSATVFDANTAMVTRTMKRRKVTATIRPIRDSRERFLAVLISLREDVKKVYM